jgi:hypothetical protein
MADILEEPLDEDRRGRPRFRRDHAVEQDLSRPTWLR